MARSISDAVVFFNYTFKTKLSVFFLLTVDITLTPPPIWPKICDKKGGGNIVSDRRPSSESNKNPTKKILFLTFQLKIANNWVIKGGGDLARDRPPRAKSG